MAKQATDHDARPGASGRKAAVRLEKARAAQHKAERKVGKLRARLEAAESKLSKRAQRVTLLQARIQRDHATPPSEGVPRKRAKARSATPEDRLAAIGMEEPATATQATAQDGAQALSQDDLVAAHAVGVEELHAPDGGRPRKPAHGRASHGQRATAEQNQPAL